MAEPTTDLTPTHVFQTFKDENGLTWAWQGSTLGYVQLVDSEQIGTASVPTPSNESFIIV